MGSSSSAQIHNESLIDSVTPLSRIRAMEVGWGLGSQSNYPKKDFFFFEVVRFKVAIFTGSGTRLLSELLGKRFLSNNAWQVIQKARKQSNQLFAGGAERVSINSDQVAG